MVSRRTIARWSGAGLLFHVALGAGAAAAGESQAALVPGVGDTLAVAVVGRQDLGGTFLIGPDATIRVPLVGAVRVGGRDLQQIEDELAERLGRMIDGGGMVTVDVAAWRPIFVIGDVNNPGEQPWSPGVSALNAYARAGGSLSVHRVATNQAFQTAGAERDLRIARTQLQALLIRRAALDAALADGEGEVDMPGELEPLGGAPLAAELLARERALLAEERRSLQDRVEMLARQRDEFREEVVALEGQAESLLRQKALIEVELKRMGGLEKQGLVTSARMLTLKQLEADIAADLHRAAAFLSRARQQQIAIDLRVAEAREAWRREPLRERARIAAEIESARARAEAAGAQLVALSGTQSQNLVFGRPQMRFVVTRATADGTRIVQAAPGTALFPGDILEVEISHALQTAGGGSGE